jgi:di/tricarboxylate transporter
MAAGMMPSTMGAAFLTGAEATLLAGRLIEEGTHSPQYWINTAEYLLVPALIMLAFQWVTLKKMFPSSQETVSMDFVHEQLDKLGAMKYEEKYVLVTLIAAVGLWVTDKIHHIPAEVVLIIVAIVLFLPGFGPGNWKQDSKSIAWGSIMVIAAATSFASLLTSTGVIKMIADWVGGLGITSFVEVMLLVGVITLILRLGVASVTASAALFIPLAIMVGSNAGFSQGQLVALGWITYVFCRAGYFLPSQTASLMMTFDYGYFGQNDLIKVGIKLTLATVLVYGLWASFVIPALVK